VKLKSEYFEDRRRIAEIELKIVEAIPAGEYYHVIILALHNIEATMIRSWAKNENSNRWLEKEKP